MLKAKVKKSADDILFDNALKALRSAVRKALAEKKLHGWPAYIWRNGKVVKVKASQL